MSKIENTDAEDVVKEIQDIFDNQTVPVYPWGLNRLGNGDFELVDKNGICLYILSVPDYGTAATSAERAGARAVIESSAFYVSTLLDEQRRLLDLSIDLKDTLNEVRDALDRME